MKNSNQESRVSLLIVLFVLSGLAIRLYISWLDIETLFQKAVVDDAFFYLKLAQNIAAGNGATFDGEVLTNGFNPLYTLLLVLVFWMFPDNLNVPVHLALTILSVFNVLTGIVVFLIVREIAGKFAGLIASFIWLFNPYVIMISLNGVEASIVAFFLSLCIYQYIKMRITGGFSLQSIILLGILTALSILSRVDAVFMLIAITLDMLYLSYQKEKRLVPSFYKPALFASITLFVLSPWFLWNFYNFGTIRQISGIVLPFTAHTMYLAKYKTYFSISFIRHELFHLHTWLAHIVKFGGGTLLIFLSLGILVGSMHNNGKGYGKTSFINLKIVNFLLLFSALTIGFYALYFWGWLRTWYYLSIILVVTIYLGLIFSLLKEKIKGWGIKGVLMILLFLFFNFSYYGYIAWKDGLFPFQKQLYEATIWINQNTEENSRIGAFSSGIFGYLGNRKVIDLAGVVNQEVHHAKKGKRLDDYFKQARLDYLIDRQDMVEFHQRFAKTDYLESLERVTRFGPNPSDLVVYKFKLKKP
jgi:hypothetical protein